MKNLSNRIVRDKDISHLLGEILKTFHDVENVDLKLNLSNNKSFGYKSWTNIKKYFEL